MYMNMEIARVQLGRRGRELRECWTREGLRMTTQRLRTFIARHLAPRNVTFPFDQQEILAADLRRPFQASVPTITPGQPLVVNWVVPPAGPGAGGTTTIFRIIRYLENHGYQNRIYLYDVEKRDPRYNEWLIRDGYNFEGFVATLDRRMLDAHAVVASYWATAYPVFNARCAGKRFYFVQDYEPYFFPVGALSFLAENTYRMGFHAITAGKWLTQKLTAEFKMPADYFDFGCDVSRYRRLPDVKRTGIVFYARPDAPRRGVELGVMALELFASRHPEIEIHLYGNKMGRLPFRCIDHGHITPDDLNQIYNRCYAGLSLSLTNVSLVPHEMLAAGCIPVVNDAVHNRMVLDNSFIRYAALHPHALAAELDLLVTLRDFQELSIAASASVHSTSWDDAGAQVDTIFRRALEVNAQPEEQALARLYS
jgi:O-antigen biosynthesis protein